MIELKTTIGGTHVYWRGRYLRPAKGTTLLHLDEWACRKIETAGLSPTIKPGRGMYFDLVLQALNLTRLSMYPQRYIHPKNAGKRMLIWTPPRTDAAEEEQLLADILNTLVGGEPFDASDARHVLAQHTEKLEAEAQRAGIVTANCKAQIHLVHHCLSELGFLNHADIERGLVLVLEQYQQQQFDSGEMYDAIDITEDLP